MRTGIWRTRGNGEKPICSWRTAGTSASPTNPIESRRVARAGDLLLGRFGRGRECGGLRREGIDHRFVRQLIMVFDEPETVDCDLDAAHFLVQGDAGRERLGCVETVRERPGVIFLVPFLDQAERRLGGFVLEHDDGQVRPVRRGVVGRGGLEFGNELRDILQRDRERDRDRAFDGARERVGSQELDIHQFDDEDRRVGIRLLFFGVLERIPHMDPVPDVQIDVLPHGACDRLLQTRIAILDGAMGTMIQAQRLDESGFRGRQFVNHPSDLKGCNDLLCITRPELVEAIHRQYLEAGADIIETNTFNSTSISMADYKLEHLVYDLNVAGARVARRAVEKVMGADPARPRFVAGAIGPTNRTASMSPNVNNPAFRAITFDQLVEAYTEQVSGLIDGGVDLLLCETVFDTLNLKAALFAVDQYFETKGRRVPVMVSVTITDRSGRTLSGQTVEAFWNSIAHMPLLSVGINCALGAKQMRPYIEELSQIAPVFISCYPNAGLPNAFGGFDETPEIMSADLREFSERGWLNIVGGCCGTTPAHIKALAEAVRELSPRTPATPEPYTRLSGLEPLTIRPDTNFVNIGERTNVTGSPAFAKLVLSGDYEGALAVARQPVDGGAQIIDVNMDEAMLDSKEAMSTFLRLIASEPDIARVPIMIDSSKWEVIEAGLKCVQGKGIVNSISLKEGEETFKRYARLVKRYGAAVVVMAFDEVGQADTLNRKVEICTRAYRILTQEIGLPPQDIIFDRNILTVATGIEAHNNYAVDLI